MIALAALFVALAPLPTQAWTYQVIYDFCSKRACVDGAAPEAALVMDSAGNLYGTTHGGIGQDGGTVFELSPGLTGNRWSYHRLHSFCYECAYLSSKLIIDTAGNVYGTSYDPGFAFELSPNAERRKWTYAKIHDITDGFAGPIGPLSYRGEASGAPYDGASPLYAATYLSGFVSTLTPNAGAWRLRTLYKLNTRVYGGIFVADDNTLFGSTIFGGPLDRGTLYQLVNDGGSWSENVLHYFCSEDPYCADGASPRSSLTEDAAGDLYGTTDGGGTNHKGCCGVVFKLVPSGGSWQYTTVYNFCTLKNCKDGANPDTDLIFDSVGSLYGSTSTGGGHLVDQNHLGGGTVFRLVGSTLETIYAFCSERDCRDGEYPYGGVVMDAAGNLFGTTSQGGKYGAGVVYEISP